MKSIKRSDCSYWAECSNEVFEGPMFAKIKINNITNTEVFIGLQLANSSKSNDFYNDGVFLYGSGGTLQPFSSSLGQFLLRKLENGDILLMRRDQNNSVD